MANIQREFGGRVRFLRQHAGMSQERLAAKAGLHTTYISGVERGVYNVSLQNVVKLAKALDIPVPELFEGETASTLLVSPVGETKIDVTRERAKRTRNLPSARVLPRPTERFRREIAQ